MQSESLAVSDDLREASGIARHGDELLIVADANPGAYFCVPIGPNDGALVPFPSASTHRHAFAGAELAVDFESIDVLGDGRIVALSERLRCLVGEKGIVVQYDDPLSEFGERGLEGLAVRPNSDSSSDVAVLWEGGYVEDAEVQPQLRSLVQGKALLPVIFRHRIAPNETGFKLKVDSDSELIALQVPVPDREENGWRFRAPDLVWHTWSNADRASQDGFIVLLNSQLQRKQAGKSKFGPCWLQRFTPDGAPSGDPIDLDDLARRTLNDTSLQGANWEGVTWFEAGRRLILVHDQSKSVSVASALIVELPASWIVRSN